MDKKILELYPLTFTAEEARKLTNVLTPSSLDKIFYNIYRKALRGDSTVEFPIEEISPEIIRIVRELGYMVVSNDKNCEISWY